MSDPKLKPRAPWSRARSRAVGLSCTRIASRFRSGAPVNLRLCLMNSGSGRPRLPKFGRMSGGAAPVATPGARGSCAAPASNLDAACSSRSSSGRRGPSSAWAMLLAATLGARASSAPASVDRGCSSVISRVGLLGPAD